MANVGSVLEPLHILSDQNFDCESCTKCCRGWRIAVDARSAAGLRERGGPAALETRQDRIFTAKQNDASCYFLQNSLCSVHDIKPSGCRQFPFRLCRTPDGVYAGVSFYCSAVQSDQGRPLEAHRPDLESFVAQLPLIGAEPLPVDKEVSLDWTAYRALDTFLLEGLRDQPLDEVLGASLWSLCELVRNGSGVVTRARLETSLHAALEALQPPNQPFAVLEPHWGCALLAHVEQLARADLQADLRLRFGSGWHGRLSEAPRPASEIELRRYLRALVFRKFLILRRPLLHNLAALYLLPWLFRSCSGLAGAARGEREDARAGWDACEYRVYTHGASVDSLFAEIAAGFLE